MLPYSGEDIDRVFEEQNPWFTTGSVPMTLAPPTERPLVRKLLRALRDDSLHRYQLILGPRRVGKTTAMHQCVRALLESGVPPKRIWWFRVDHPILMKVQLDTLVSPLAHAADDQPTYVFIDEIAYSENWDSWLKSFYDDRLPIRLAATSSAAAILHDRRMESGVGRWQERYLAPYLLPEYLDLLGEGPDVDVGGSLDETLASLVAHPSRATGRWDQHRRRMLLAGGFPELLLRLTPDDDETALLESQRVLRDDAVERAIYKDIPQSFGIDNPIMLERLLYVLAEQVAGLVSPTRLSSELGIAQPTVGRYISYLERAYLLFQLPNFSGRESTVQKRGRKVYFVDPAVRNAALQRGIAPLHRPDELGVLYENMAAAHLHALGAQTGVRVHHWREGRDEVDLVYNHPSAPLAFEIASSAGHHRRGLRRLQERHERFRGRCYVVAPRVRSTAPSPANDGVGTVALDLFLIAVGRQAAEATS